MHPTHSQIAMFHTLLVGPSLVMVARRGRVAPLSPTMAQALMVAGAGVSLYHGYNLYKMYTAPVVTAAVVIMATEESDELPPPKEHMD